MKTRLAYTLSKYNIDNFYDDMILLDKMEEEFELEETFITIAMNSSSFEHTESYGKVEPKVDKRKFSKLLDEAYAHKIIAGRNYGYLKHYLTLDRKKNALGCISPRFSYVLNYDGYFRLCQANLFDKVVGSIDSIRTVFSEFSQDTRLRTYDCEFKDTCHSGCHRRYDIHQ
jgi:hypothetical protein